MRRLSDKLTHNRFPQPKGNEDVEGIDDMVLLGIDVILVGFVGFVEVVISGQVEAGPVETPLSILRDKLTHNRLPQPNGSEELGEGSVKVLLGTDVRIFGIVGLVTTVDVGADPVEALFRRPSDMLTHNRLSHPKGNEELDGGSDVVLLGIEVIVGFADDGVGADPVEAPLTRPSDILTHKRLPHPKGNDEVETEELGFTAFAEVIVESTRPAVPAELPGLRRPNDIDTQSRLPHPKGSNDVDTGDVVVATIPEATVGVVRPAMLEELPWFWMLKDIETQSRLPHPNGKDEVRLETLVTCKLPEVIDGELMDCDVRGIAGRLLDVMIGVMVADPALLPRSDRETLTHRRSVHPKAREELKEGARVVTGTLAEVIG